MAKSLKVNDKVMVISGDHKGQTATIVKIDREHGRACLDGIEVRTRHLKKSYQNPTGGKRTVHGSIDLSNLKLVEAAAPAKSAKKSPAKKGGK